MRPAWAQLEQRQARAVWRRQRSTSPRAQTPTSLIPCGGDGLE